MSLLALMETDAASLVINANDAAQSGTHRPLNVAANDATVTGVFSETDPQESSERGVGVVRRATWTVGSAVSLSTRDRWSIDSEWWEAERVQQDGGGLQVVFLIRREDEIRSGMKSPSIV